VVAVEEVAEEAVWEAVVPLVEVASEEAPPLVLDLQDLGLQVQQQEEPQ
jgi:hypothetical protein